MYSGHPLYYNLAYGIGATVLYYFTVWYDFPSGVCEHSITLAGLGFSEVLRVAASEAPEGKKGNFYLREKEVEREGGEG